jgi:hypothetical protein
MNVLRFAPLAAVLAAAPLAAQSLTSVDPGRVVQVDPSVVSSRRTFHLVGSGITPGANVGEMLTRMHVEMRRAGGEWQTLRPGESTTNQLWPEVLSKDWLATPGDLEIRVVVDGHPTNALPIHVVPAPTTPPEISAVSPRTLRPDTAARTFSMHVLRLSEPFTVRINGVETAQFGRYDVDAGELLWYFPRELIGRPGRYPVVVSTPAGASYPVYVDVLGAPRVVSVTPGEVIREKAGDAANVRVKVAFDGSLPASARVGNDSIGWITRTSLDMADGPTAVWVDVPMEMVRKAAFGHPQQISIVLSNEAGSSTGILTARSDASNMRIQGPAGTVARPGVDTRPIARPPVTRPPVVRP